VENIGQYHVWAETSVWNWVCGDPLVDEPKLPEGTEEDHAIFEEERRAANALIERESERESSISMVRM